MELVENSNYEKELFAALWQAYRQKVIRTSRNHDSILAQTNLLEAENEKSLSED